MAADRETDRVIRQFQSETDEIREAPEPLAARLTVFTLAGMLAVCLILAGFSQIDRVVTSERGKIVAVQGVLIVQPLDPSIIKSLDAREGDIVKKGQLLATLDPTFTGADVGQLAEQLASSDAQIARTEAELEKRPMVIPSDLTTDRLNYYTIQKNFFDQRADQFKAQLRSFEEKISQSEAAIGRLQAEQGRYAERERISQEIEKMRQQLLEKQAGSYLNLLIASDQRLEMVRNMDNGRNQLIEAEHQRKSLQADRDAFVRQWFATASQERVTALNARSTTQALLTKAERRQSLVRIEAQEDSVVLTRARVSIGSVLREGETLLTLIPVNSALEAEVHIGSKDIGFVRAGDPTMLKVDAFKFIEHGHAQGKVTWISEGAFTADDDGKPVPPYYKARVAIEKMNFVRVPETFRLIPGMTLEADIRIGTRSALAYVVGGALQHAGEAMREP